MMTDYRSIMLALAHGTSWAQITADFGCSRRTIDKAQQVLRAHGFTTDEVERLGPGRIVELFPDHRRRADEEFLAPDVAAIAARRQRRQRVTLKVEHARYLAQPAAGRRHYSYKQFCALFDHYVDVSGLSPQITRVAGDEMAVDWSGTAMTVIDPITLCTAIAPIFVASLPHSGMLFATATPDMKMRSWLTAHRDALEYFGGVPRRIMPDNAATATNQIAGGVRARDVNEAYFRFGEYFGCAITPARPLKPKDKAPVEKAVDITGMWVIEFLRDRQFHSLDELNRAIIIQVDWINDRRGFRGRDTTRREVFDDAEAGELSPLPPVRWSWSTWRRASVGMNYHIRVDKHFYSVPWRFAGRQVDVQIFDEVLEVFADNESIAVHHKQPGNMGYSTLDEHVPDRHKDLSTRWDRDRIESWARSMGAATHALISQMFNARKVEAQAYSSTLAVLSLAKQYSRGELERACQQLLDRGEAASVRKVIDEIRSLTSAPADDRAPTVGPMSTTPQPRPRASDEGAKTHVRGKSAFTFREQV